MITQADRNSYIAYHNDLARPFIRRHKQLFAQAKERRDKQLVEQQETQSVQEKIQQQLLTTADLKAQIAIFQNSDNGTTKTGSDSIITNTTSTNNITNPDALNVIEEQYRTSLITNMIQLIHTKRKPA